MTGTGRWRLLFLIGTGEGKNVALWILLNDWLFFSHLSSGEPDLIGKCTTSLREICPERSVVCKSFMKVLYREYRCMHVLEDNVLCTVCAILTCRVITVHATTCVWLSLCRGGSVRHLSVINDHLKAKKKDKYHNSGIINFDAVK